MSWGLHYRDSANMAKSLRVEDDASNNPGASLQRLDSPGESLKVEDHVSDEEAQQSKDAAAGSSHSCTPVLKCSAEEVACSNINDID